MIKINKKMAKTSGSTRTTPKGPKAGIEGKDTNYKGSIRNVGGIRDIKDDTARLAVQRAVSEFAKQYGLPTREVKIADLQGVYGIGGASGIYLNRRFYNNPASILAAKAASYKSGWSVPTTAPLRHTVIHELAHSAWQSGRRANAKLTKGIQALWTRYKAEVRSGKNPIGKYATSNIDEFWAEGITQATIGRKQTYYSRKLKALLKKYGQ